MHGCIARAVGGATDRRCRLLGWRRQCRGQAAVGRLVGGLAVVGIALLMTAWPSEVRAFVVESVVANQTTLSRAES